MASDVPVRLLPIGRGDAQTKDTLEVMRDVANKALLDPLVIETAVDIVRDVDGRNPVELARAVRAWLSARIHFLPDPRVDGDFLRTPRYLLDQIDQYGFARADCDDTATLSAALGKAVGLQARFVVLAFFSRSAPFAHVFTQVRVGATAWAEFDVTEDQARARAAQGAISRTAILPV